MTHCSRPVTGSPLLSIHPFSYPSIFLLFSTPWTGWKSTVTSWVRLEYPVNLNTHVFGKW